LDEVTDQHSLLVPIIINLMNDSDSTIHYHAISALDSIVESLGDDILPYLGDLMSRLIFLFDQGDRKVRMVATACIGSAAHSAGTHFTPYFVEVINRLSVLMTLGQDIEDLDLRGIATDTAGVVAEAVGKDVFRVFFC
jgi:hypothetical protein